ncbi:MAG: PDZ domain-containing protein [Capsulimonadaceae bacterium]
MELKSVGPNYVSPATEINGNRDHVLPFVYDRLHTPEPLVLARIDGSKPHWFMLDTGSDFALWVMPWAASKIGLAPARNRDPYGRPMVQVHRVDIIGTNGDEASFSVTQAWVLKSDLLTSLYGPDRVAGLIGIGMFDNRVTRFNFETKNLTVLGAGTRPSDEQGVALPITMDPYGIPCARATLPTNTSVDLRIDTGAIGTVLPLGFANSLGPSMTFAPEVAQTLDETYFVPQFRIRSLMLGRLAFTNQSLTLLPNDQLRNCLGLDVLTQLRSFTLDLKLYKLIVDSNNCAMRERVGVPGMIFEGGSEDRSRWIVKAVTPGSPADAAGIKPQDEVISVDGTRLSNLTYPLGHLLIAGIAETTSTFTISRPRCKLLQIKLKRSGRLSGSHGPLGDLILVRHRGKVISVAYVPQTCLAYHRGVRLGDNIISIDGISTILMNADTVINLMQSNAQHELAISRSGADTNVVIDMPSGN